MRPARGYMQRLAPDGTLDGTATNPWHGGACSFCGRARGADGVTLVEGRANEAGARPVICTACLKLAAALLARGGAA